LPKALAIVKAWLSPLEWLRNNTWNYRKNGSSGYQYGSGITYAKGQISNYGGATYEATQSTIGNVPTNKTYWTLVAENMIGFDERINYQGRKKTLEYLLYRFFVNNALTINFSNNTPNSSSNHSIYIVTSQLSNSFISNSTFGSVSYKNIQTDGVFLTYTPTLTQFTINVPNSVQIAFGGTTKTTNAIKSLVNKYIIIGVTYTVNYY
jgi:hypothetical protein